MTKLKHSKYKNSGLIFELLIRQVTADTISGKQSPALDIIKKYFLKSELSKEYKLYESLLKKLPLIESTANITINTILETSKKLNRSTLRREKYNLIKEIRDNYNLDDFFKIKLPNYKAYAALYSLMEVYNNDNLVNPDAIISNKVTLLEILTTSKINKKEVKDEVIEEFKKYDKDLRILTYRILLEKFNDKYDGFNGKQKSVLKQFITEVDSTPKLKEFYNTQISEIKTELKNLIKSVDDKVTVIKLNEIINIISELSKESSIKNEDIVNLLQYYQLIDEIRTASK
jgi:hypothetical protein